MRYSWKEIMALICNALGVCGWIYIGVWMVLTKPVKDVVMAQLSGNLSPIMLIGALFQVFIYLSLAGGVWCAGYILSNRFKEME